MEAMLYDKGDDLQVRCHVCSHFCVIKNGGRGICRIRENRDGKLVFLAYSKVISTSVDPIEKKPIYHFKPGSSSFSFATVGCNFQCSFCQNSQIAHMPHENNGRIQGRSISPGQLVEAAVTAGCKSISYTYTEPTVFLELALDTAKLAREKGLYNIFVTNGYMSDKTLSSLEGSLDAANVDLKSFDPMFYRNYCKAKLEPVLSNLKQMKEMGLLVEITTLLIPGLNDDIDQVSNIAEFIAGDLGQETPWHISRFHPCYKMTDRSVTPAESLETAYKAGKDAGLRYVYIGNMPGQSKENTYCHECSTLLVKRTGYHTDYLMEENGSCPECRTSAYGIY